MNNNMELQKVLSALDAPGDAFQQFEKYHTLLLDWNRRVNLISRNDESRIVRRHFIDSLALMKAVSFSQNIRILDIGTGAGFPGLPIKIVRPDIDLVLLESKRKKGLFLRQLVADLNLSATEIIIGRAEETLSEIAPVDRVISRAVADTKTLLRWSIPFLNPTGGNIVTLKGKDAENELQHLPAIYKETIGIKSRFLTYRPFPEIYPDIEKYIIDISLAELSS